MRVIDQSNWPRRQHFELFRNWSNPHLNLSANVDITEYRAAVKQVGVSFTVGIIYMIAKTANAIPEFRQRIRGDQVVEHEVVHPSSTILAENDLFSFCYFTYIEEFSTFAAQSQAKIDLAKKDPWIGDDSDNDAQLFMTSIPWVSFTSLMHPLNTPVDSIPRFAWGKFFQDRGRLMMPLSVQGHHALLDGLHIGRYFERIQEYFNYPNL